MFRQVGQGFLQIVCDLCHSPYIQKARIFTQNSRRGIAAERRVIFGGTPAWIDLERGKLAARSNNARANKHQTNKSLYAALAPSSGRTRCETQNPRDLCAVLSQTEIKQGHPVYRSDNSNAGTEMTQVFTTTRSDFRSP